MQTTIKSKERVQKYGEVYTPPEIVSDMCDLAKDEIARIDSRALEPACGNGNFLAEILRRKLDSCHPKYDTEVGNYIWRSKIALTSVYGIDILPDNVRECRERLLKIWLDEYMKRAGRIPERTIEAARVVLNYNIVCGNTLTYWMIDEETGKQTYRPLTLTEWWHDGFYSTIWPIGFEGWEYKYEDLVEGNENGPIDRYMIHF